MNYRTATKIQIEDACLSLACNGVISEDLRSREYHYKIGDMEYILSDQAYLQDYLNELRIEDIRDVIILRKYMEQIGF